MTLSPITRRSLWLLTTLSFLLGCTQKSKDQTAEQQNITEPSSVLLSNDPDQSQAVWIELWKSMTYSVDTPPLDRITELMKIASEEFPKLTPNDALFALYSLRETIDQELSTLDEQTTDLRDEYGTALYYMREEGKAIPDSTQAKLRPFKEKGLHIEHAGEGCFMFALIEPTLPDLAQYLPKDYRAIWELMVDTESYLEDGAVTKTWEELGNALIRFEHFAEKYPNDKEDQHFHAINTAYIPLLNVYLYGVDNSPITINGVEGPLKTDIKEEYQRFRQAYPDSPTADLIELLLAEPTITKESIQKVRQAHKSSDYPLWSHYHTSWDKEQE